MKEAIEGTAVVVQEEQTPAPSQDNSVIAVKSVFDMAPSQFKKGLDRRRTNREALIDWIKEKLVEGTDWGRIHVVKRDKCPHGRYCQDPYHFSKPSLWKSGAEKIVGMLGFRTTWADLEEAKDHIKDGQPLIILTCHILNDDGALLSEGMGARLLASDGGDVNKAIKMAKKSSMIDAVLNLAGLSEIFTQDIEDMDRDKIGAGPDPYNKHEEPSESYFPQSHDQQLATHCPIGKNWKGKPWEEVEEGFLRWIISNVDDKPELVARAQKELGSRSVESDAAKSRRVETNNPEPSGKRLADYARELVAARTIDQVLEIKDELPSELEPSLRTLIASRETELGPK